MGYNITKEDIIAMAREAGLAKYGNGLREGIYPFIESIERFAALVAQRVLAGSYPEMIALVAAATKAEEPVAWALYQRNRLLSFWMDKGDAYDFEFTSEHRWEPLYTSPPTLSLAQRTWVGLTQNEFRDFASTLEYGTGGLIRAIEAKLKEKNT